MKVTTLGSSSHGNCYIVESFDGSIILDAGLPITTIKKHVRLSEVSAALITHEHKDHCAAVGGLLKSSVNVYMSEGTKGAMGLNRHHRLITCKAYEDFKTTDGKWTIKPLTIFHDVAEPLGFLVTSTAEIESLVYITDTYGFDSIINGASIYMIECNYDKEIIDNNVIEGRLNPMLARRIKKTHLDIDSVVNYLKRCDLSKAKEIRLLHLSNQNSDEDAFKLAIQRATGVITYVERA